MSRRERSILEDLIDCPWQFVLGLAIFVYISLTYLVPRFWPQSLGSPMLQNGIKGAAPNAAKLLSFVLFPAAALSAFRQWIARRRR